MQRQQKHPPVMIPSTHLEVLRPEWILPTVSPTIFGSPRVESIHDMIQTNRNRSSLLVISRIVIVIGCFFVNVSSLSSVTRLAMSSLKDSSCNKRTQRIFRGQTILLTGASGGLGRSLALQLAHCKATRIVLSGRNQEALEQLADECKSIYPTMMTHVIPADLGAPQSVQELAIKALAVTSGRIDILINNGGVSSRSRFLDTKLQVDETLLQINFLAGAALAKAILPGMVERGFGKLIWVSSVQGLMGIPNRTSYAASKFAVQGYCEALRGEVATSGISVHVASPGYIRTNLSQSAMTGEGQPHGVMDKTTANGAPPNEIAVTILEQVAKGKADFVVAADFSAKAAIWLRFLAPALLNKMLVKRYEKSLKER